MSSVGPDLLGTTLDGRYTLVRPLGEGAMGQVYVADQLGLGLGPGLARKVAVKVLHPWLAAQPKHRERFVREARAASRIKHPNVVEIVDFGTTADDAVYLVMELLEGWDLRAILRRDGPLPWARARHYLLQSVAALREAHRHGVIHRDIKPANCFVCEPEQPGLPERMKLLDFGIAKLGDDPDGSATGTDGKHLTQTGELVGTLAYMAPEFAEGQSASPLTDMYALGIMAYELITGNVPFTGRNEFQVLARHLSEPPVRPRVLVPTLPEAAEAVLLTLLAKKPELRFETMADVEQALLAIPADARDMPRMVPRGRDGSEPVVRRRESSAPSREGSGPRSAAPPMGRAPRGPAEPTGPAEPSVRTAGFGSTAAPEAGAPTHAVPDWRDHWAVGESVEAYHPNEDVRAFVDDDDEPKPPREWGTFVTVVLLVLLLGAGVASVVLRQQGIELPWSWSSPQEAEPAPAGPDGARSP